MSVTRQEQLITEIRRTVQKRDSIMLKYNWRQEDALGGLSLPKITSKVARKKQSSTQVERHIASLKYNIMKTNQNLDSLDKKIEEKTSDFKCLNQEMMMTQKNLSISEKVVRSKHDILVLNKANRALSLFSAYVSQKKAKELGNFRKKALSKSSRFLNPRRLN